MDRRRFLGASVAGGMALGGAAALQQASPAYGQTSNLPSKFTPAAYTVPRSPNSAFLTPDYYTYADNLVIERNQPGKPHQGKVLAAIQAHSDDITLLTLSEMAVWSAGADGEARSQRASPRKWRKGRECRTCAGGLRRWRGSVHCGAIRPIPVYSASGHPTAFGRRPAVCLETYSRKGRERGG
jgi:hypothetical protein